MILTNLFQYQRNKLLRISPTLIQETGVGIRFPFYISLTPDHKKSLLNTFKQIKTEQLVNSDENKASQESLGTPIEKALGMNIALETLSSQVSACQRGFS